MRSVSKVAPPAAAKYGLGYQTNNMSAKIAAATSALMPRWISAACARREAGQIFGCERIQWDTVPVELPGCRGCRGYP